MRDHVPLIVIVALLLGGGFALMMLADAANDRRLDRSLIGVDGLAVWLAENDVPVRRSNRRSSPNIGELGLRVFPLYDMDLASEAEEPADTGELIRQQTQRDLRSNVYWDKLTEIPTVVLMPKWTTGFVETGIAHEMTLVPLSAYNRLFEQLDLEGLKLLRDSARFVSERIGGTNRHDAALFHAQTFDSDSLPAGCQEYLRFGRGALMMACTLENADHLAYFVADPDLFNNHGLSVAQNAAFAADYLVELSPDSTKPIYVDTIPGILTQWEPVDDERQDYQRTGDDLARFFEYPLSVLWAIMLFVLAVLFWRGAIRFGPLERPSETSIDQSKSVAIATKARLLRLSESDGQMVADFVRTQLMDLVSNTFGQDAGEAGQKRFFAHLSRRDAGLASAFQATCETLISNAARMPHAELFKLLETYKNLLEKVEQANGSIGISKSR